MGKQWIGFQGAAKPVPGRQLVESAVIEAALGNPEIVALLTTRAGLERWLGAASAFSDRPGGSIDFIAPDGGFGGSYTLIDIPRRVVLVTEKHGEVDIRLDVRTRPTRLSVTVTRFVADTEDGASAHAVMLEAIEAISRACADGR
jgi:uncharacterized protein YndB with AHSA1/START domain